MRKDSNNTKQGKVTRRNFLKKLGLGAAGIGALTLSPASALNIKDDNLDIYTGTSKNNLQKYFSVNQGGPVQIQNTDLKMNNNTIRNLSNPSNNQDAATKNYVDNNAGGSAEEALAYDFVL